MKISHGTRIAVIDDRNGYGYACQQMLDSFDRLGYEWSRNDPTADVEIWFDQPQHWKFSDGPYKIGYHPWESTELKPGWSEIMNQCDEIWTPSPVIAEWYQKYAGITVPVYVYQHGVDPLWQPVKRRVEDKFKFLHVGAEAARKGFKETCEGLDKAFPKQDDVEVNFKMINDGWNIGKMYRKNYINGAWKIERLIQMFHDNHVFIYPSHGEGFGLTPLQALATGMPTITVPGWAPYVQFLDPKLSIGSHLATTLWPRLHPGQMLKPSVDDVATAMRYAYDNYEAVEAEARGRVDEIMSFYDWDRLTLEAFENLEDRLKNS